MKKEFCVKCFCWVMVLSFLGGCAVFQKKDQVCSKKECVDVEVVYKSEDRKKGLQHRTFMGKNNGMLFIFQWSSAYRFWMKDTFIPLDMIWLDENRKIVYIEENVPPCQKDPCPSYGPSEQALYVLEVNAGRVKEWSLEKGDVMDFKLYSYDF